MSENQKLFALLIDGDNTQAAHIPQILRTLCEYGEPRISKVFHNKTTIEQWEQIARKHSIEPIWVPNNTKQKNSVDIALVMDAMILRYERHEITGFCIVASDGDYTRLARYLKSQGKFVLGIGEQKTPEPFYNACTEFSYIRDAEDEVSATLPSQQSTSVSEEISTPISDDYFLKLFVEAHKQALEKSVQGKQGLVTLREIWEAIKGLDAEFSSEFPKMPAFVNKVMTYPENILLEEQPDIKPVAHYVHIKQPGGGEIDKFREAYKHATEVLKLKDKHGWVKLSVIGDTLLELYGVKHTQLKKVIEKIMVDYPNIIELDTNSQVLQMRFKK